jgi:hypothetical protein
VQEENRPDEAAQLAGGLLRRPALLVIAEPFDQIDRALMKAR